jgi:hypothetical protein
MSLQEDHVKVYILKGTSTTTRKENQGGRQSLPHPASASCSAYPFRGKE